MKIFTIEADTNDITVHATAKEAEAVANAERFRGEEGLAELAVSWPAFRLVEIWNSLPGVSPVKKFKDRQTAVGRIWKAIQTLGHATAVEEEPEPVPNMVTATLVGLQTTDVASQGARAKNRATRAKQVPEAGTKGKKGRPGSKAESIFALMKQPGGTTLKTIMEATRWQAHSVRGFISGTLGKKMGLTVTSVKGESGERTYSIQA
jgi:hypothetical protein